VARAKRTDRAEARRKYRAYLQAQEEAEIAEAREHGGADEAPTSTPRVRDQRSSAAPVPGARMGLFAAARAAYRTPTYVSDIRNIRSLVVGSKAVWPVLIMCVVGGAYMSIRISAGSSGASNDPILSTVYQFVFYPIPLLPPMLAGFLAPRATWLAGLIAAFIATITLVVVVGLNVGSFSNTTGAISVASATPGATAVASALASGSVVPSSGASLVASATPAVSGSPAASATASRSPAAGASSSTGSNGKSNSNTVGDLFNLAIMLLVQSLGFGAIIGALSGWYKRFLGLTSGGSRKPPASRPNRGRPTQRRRPATR
jgi:hypothetical protein